MNVVIYSRKGCIYCDMATEVAIQKGLNVEKKELGVDYTVEDFTAKFPYAHTVPQIVVDGEHVGGYQDLKDYLGNPDRL